MIIPMLCVTIFVILVVWFLLPRVARLMIHTPTAISIFVCLSMVRSEERFSRNAETDLVCRLLLEKNKLEEGAHLRDGMGLDVELDAATREVDRARVDDMYRNLITNLD